MKIIMDLGVNRKTNRETTVPICVLQGPRIHYNGLGATAGVPNGLQLNIGGHSSRTSYDLPMGMDPSNKNGCRMWTTLFKFYQL